MASAVKGYLVLETGMPQGLRKPVGSSIIIGRTPDCGFVINDPSASRHHVEIVAHGTVFNWRDLGSTNGTILNGTRMIEGELRHGDKITIGATVLRFEIEADTPARPTPKSSAVSESTLTFGTDFNPSAQQGHSPAELLEAAYSVLNAISSNYETCSLQDQILETTMKAIRGQHGGIFFAGEGENQLAPCPVCHKVHTIREGRLERVNVDAVRISRTAARRVLTGGESVLYRDKITDSDLNMADSVMALNLRSIMCVPLRAKSKILGILYVDADRENHTYSRDDLLLCAAVGNGAGLAIENASMHQQILERQRIEQEIAHAWMIQQGFLIREWPTAGTGRFEVYGETRPARVAGGDFYDFVHVDADHAGILIGNVSGKGVPTSLSMAQLLAEFRRCAHYVVSPVEVLKSLNADLVKQSPNSTFCTLCYLTVNLATGRTLCANAGHHPALLIRPDGVELAGHASGQPAGVSASPTWVDAEWNLSAGDTVLLYTNGVVSARHSESGDELGIEGLARIARNFHAHPPRGLIEAVNDAVTAYCAPARPHDDCTMIALRRL
ncbi:MAG TPA: SpoIIE family protein phosphatase [Candidatus Hydrogenedentes bacterium]|nr:SpoIIE family protein phosphatase [Candidatus Hydrogenedentota bacterium]HRT19578.1 SpoIIE family protein phosphatase [Candidatus Hydrogenedentota bacterium]HRT64166.1 SpoIIE family protein phosphatase [Candidatus Hydrogenedentota bacterium]